jgi:AraC family transcriptional activator of pobA
MQKHVPVLNSCTFSQGGEEKMHIDHFNNHLKKNKDLVFPHRHNFYHMVLFTRGGGKHAIDFTTFEVRPGHMYFMSPGQIHTWAFEGEVDGYVINFSKDFFHSFLLHPDFLASFSFFGGLPDSGVIILNDQLLKQVTDLCESLFVKLTDAAAIQWDAIRIKLLYLFVLIEQGAGGTAKNKIPGYNYATLRNFHHLVESHYNTIRLPKAYADKLYITPNHLNALCKEYLGMQAGEVIRTRILLEAKRLLASYDMNVSEISYELGFKDNSYFTKFFKKSMNITPEDFRKSLINKGSEDF